jgi:hypothetical protein
MAIRLRRVEGQWVALCAVESDPKEGDVYIDDAQDSALRVKFMQDYDVPGRDYDLERLMETQKVRDARETLEAWLAS